MTEKRSSQLICPTIPGVLRQVLFHRFFFEIMGSARLNSAEGWTEICIFNLLV